jgi:hypothetical protein
LAGVLAGGFLALAAGLPFDLTGLGADLALAAGFAAGLAVDFFAGRFGAALAAVLPAVPLRLGVGFLAGLLVTSTSLLALMLIPASRSAMVVILRRFGRADCSHAGAQ